MASLNPFGWLRGEGLRAVSIRAALSFRTRLKPAHVSATIFVATFSAVAVSPAVAATPPAPLAHESFGDWQSVCALQNGKRRCAVIQQRAVVQSGGDITQRIFAVELAPEGDGAAGTLILPFGLDLAQGVTLVLGDGQAGPAQPFRTCIPSGCIVHIQFGSEGLARLRSSENLELKVKALSENAQTTIPVSLKGFSEAFDRAREQTQ